MMKYKSNVKRKIKKKINMSRLDHRRLGKQPIGKVKVSNNQVNFTGKNVVSKKYNDLIIIEKRQPISIIITAWKTDKYIEECLDSIQNQTYFKDYDNYEILVGVDACDVTLKKLLKIRNKYSNLRIFVMKKNVGTYITSNTLLEISKYDNIIRFDSDDQMLPQMVNEIMLHADTYDFIRFKFIRNNNQIGFHAAGVVYYKRSLINKLGGYRPWRCTADSELIYRSKKIIKEKLIDIPLFIYRTHSTSLSKTEKLNTRKEHKKTFGKDNKIKIDRIISTYKEIL